MRCIVYLYKYKLQFKNKSVIVVIYSFRLNFTILLIFLKCVEVSLKAYMGATSQALMREAVRPLLKLEKEKDIILVQVGGQ